MADVSEALPVALRTHLASSEVEAEHRHASIGFVRFEGVDDMLERSGALAVATALHELLVAVQQAADEQAVTFLTTDIDRDGGKIVLASGVPAVLGNDEGRILRALRQIVSGQHPLRVRAGVNGDPLFAGEVGAPYRRTYTVMGDTVNLAARLMAAARPGQLLATVGVLERSRTSFDLQALEPLQVKGKAKPVQAFSVGPVSKVAAPKARRRRALPFVGRRDELAVLQEMLSEAWSGRGGVVEIVGEAGIGEVTPGRGTGWAGGGCDGRHGHLRVLRVRHALFDGQRPAPPASRRTGRCPVGTGASPATGGGDR